MAHIAKPGRFRKLFEVGIKPHVYMALQIFIDHFTAEAPETKPLAFFADPEVLSKYPWWPALAKRIKKDADRYALGKRVIHAKNYDMKPPTFRDYVIAESEGKVVLLLRESIAYLSAHEHLFPEIVEQQQETLARAKKDRIIYNLFGHPREITSPWSDALGREVLSHCPQSTVGVLTHIAYTKLDQYIRKNRLPWRILINKHDSYVTAFPDTTEHEEHCCSKMTEFLAQELTAPDGHTFKMEVELMSGYNVGKWVTEDNPRGLKEVAL